MSNISKIKIKNADGTEKEYSVSDSDIGTKIGDLSDLATTDKSSLVNAINEVANNSSGGSENTGEIIGNLEDLATTDKSNLVNAINEVNTNANAAKSNASTAISRIGTLSSLNTSTKTNLVNAINEVKNSVTSTTTTLSSGLKVVEERTILYSGNALFNGCYFPLTISTKAQFQSFDYIEIEIPSCDAYTNDGGLYNSIRKFQTCIRAKMEATSINIYFDYTGDTSGTARIKCLMQWTNDQEIVTDFGILRLRPYLDNYNYEYDKMCIGFSDTSYIGYDDHNMLLSKANIYGVKVRAVNE